MRTRRGVLTSRVQQHSSCCGWVRHPAVVLGAALFCLLSQLARHRGGTGGRMAPSSSAPTRRSKKCLLKLMCSL